MKIFGFDIETIPCRDLPSECVPAFNPGDIKLGNLKDPAKIKAKLEEVRLGFEGNKNKIMSIDPSLCEVCAFVGIFYDTQKEQIVDETKVSVVGDEDNDYEAIYQGWDAIKQAYNAKMPIVSYNGIGFDLPVMQHRAIYNDIPFSPRMYSLLTKKWEGNAHHYDLMLVLSGWNNTRWKKLDFYLKRLNLGSKTEGMDGSMVFDTWKNGEHQKILDYCRDDVLETCKLFARIEPWIVY